MARKRDDLRAAQLEQVKVMEDFECGLIVLGMGGGKTVAGLTAMLDLMQDGDLDYAVVLAPARVVNRWPQEPERWQHLLGFGVVALTGTPARRKKLLESDQRVFVCSIENSGWLVETMAEMDWPFERTMLVIDEISKFKAPASKRRKKLMQYAPRFDSRWGLSGTPRPNGYEDLFVPLKIIAGPDVWGIRDFDEWRDMYFYKLDYHGYSYAVQPHAVDILDKVVRKFTFAFDAGDLGMPDLLTGGDFDVWVNPAEDQKASYDEMYEDLLMELDVGEDDPLFVEAMSQAIGSGKLAQVVQGFVYEDGETVYKFKRNPKLGALEDMLSEMQGDNVAICYHFREELEDLKALLGPDTPHLGSGVSDKKANLLIDEWNAGKVPRMLMHPASVGHGVELQHGGHHLIWYHPTWSSELYSQTIKRFHRPGQTDMVRNWRILMSGTLDVIKDARVESKQAEETAFIEKIRR